MKKRYLYSLLFALPGFVISLVMAFAVFGAAAGFLWLFVFGDNNWPDSTEKILPVLLVLTFLVLWIASIAAGYVTGKKFEADPELNKKHLLASAGLTIAPILFIVLYQLQVGNLGTKPDSVLCSDFCLGKGYSFSEMPPKNSGDKGCVCLDASGKEALRVPLAKIFPEERKGGKDAN
jgi:hypothetical protein